MLSDHPLRFVAGNVYKIKGVVVVTGKIHSGSIKVGMELVCGNNGLKSTVSSIQINRQSVEEAFCRDLVGLGLKEINTKDVKRGFVFGESGDPPRYAISFRAQIIILNHPNRISVGYTPLMKCHSASVACKMVEFENKLDIGTGKVVDKTPP